MIGLGTIVNTIAIVIGSLVGIIIGHKLPNRLQTILVKACGLTIIGIGIKMFFGTQQVIIVLSSLLFGGIIGELINIEAFLAKVGAKIKSSIKTDNKTFIEGFVVTSIIYCTGPMAILGAIADGLNSQHDILFTKSILDGVISIAFAASLGIGVLFSSVPVLIYQGAITIMAVLLGNLFTTPMISELTATGGLLLASIGINLICIFEDKNKIPVGNLLPAIVFAPLIVWICNLLGI